MRQTIEGGRSFLGKVRDGIKSFTTTPPEEIARARSILSGEMEASQAEINSYRRSLMTVAAIQAGSGEMIDRIVAHSQTQRYASMTQEDWKIDYFRHLKNTVEAQDRKLVKNTPKQ